MSLVRACLLPFLLLVLIASPSLAQTQDAVSLFADDVRYETQTRRVIARGNVEVFFGPARLTAKEITYDAEANRVMAVGPLRLETGDGTVILASLAELSTDFREGLIKGARLLLDRQFQIAAVEGQRSRGRLNTLYKTVASSCSVCAENPRPLWQIRARKVVHDEERDRIYFESAWLDIFGIPVGYVPRLRVPAPGVDRASGLLVPSFSNSDIFGFGVKLPYYITLGDHADATLTPFLTTRGATIIEAEYRRQLRFGEFTLGGALAFDDKVNRENGRGFIEADGRFNLARDFVAEFSLDLVSDKEFLEQFDYSSADRLNSFVSLNRYGERSFVDIRAEGYQTLRENEDQGQIPVVLPWVQGRKIWYDGPVPGKLGLSASLLGLGREDGRDELRAAASLDWRAEATLSNGMQLAALAELEAELYQVDDDPAFEGRTLARATPTVGAALRWPFVNYARRATHVIEPVFQLLHTDTRGDEDVPNEDSLLVELDETNLFTLDRFPGLDAHEQGLRLNYGVTYTRYDPEGWNIGVTVGQVFSRADRDNFAEGTGLSTRQSDIAASLSFELPPEFSLIGRTLFDTSFDFKRAELDLEYEQSDLAVNAAYTFLAPDDTNPVLGDIPRREEAAFDARYRFADNWEFDAAYTYDLTEKRSVSGSAGITYGNDCAEIGLSVSRQFTTSNNVPPRTVFSFNIRLAGLGGANSDRWPAPACKAY